MVMYITSDKKKRELTILLRMTFEIIGRLICILTVGLIVGNPSKECIIPEKYRNQSINSFISSNNSNLYDNEINISKSTIKSTPLNFSIANQTIPSIYEYFSRSERYFLSISIHVILFLITFGLLIFFVHEKKGK